MKRGRGRPRKHALKPVNGSRPRGRPSTRPKVELIKEDEGDEDEEGEFHCLDCKKVFHRSSSLRKHRCDTDVQKVRVKFNISYISQTPVENAVLNEVMHYIKNGRYKSLCFIYFLKILNIFI